MANIKCPRCDRQFSSFRSRCPYCGALKRNKGKRAVDRENDTWKMVVGSAIILILIAAVAAVMIMTIAGNNAPDIGVADKDNIQNQDGSNPGGALDDDSDGVTSIDGTNPDGDADTTPDDSQPDPQPVGLTALRITTRGGEERTDITMKVGDVVRLSYRTDPDDYAGTVKWESEDQEKLIVLQSGELTARGAGTVKVTITLEDKTATCIVRIKEAG